MIFELFFSLLGSLLFLYLFWKKLREDYTQNQIFSTGFYVLFGTFLFGILANNFAPVWIFWISFSGSLFGLSIGISRYRLRVWEVLEAWVIGGIGFLWALYAYQLFFNFGWVSALGVLVLTAFYLIFQFLDNRYKRFSWYKSGKVGFTGLMVFGLLFLIRSLVATFHSDMIFFAGSIDIVVSGILAFLAFMALFNLARKEA